MIKQKAFTLIETIVALSISVVVIEISFIVSPSVLHDQEIKNFSVEINQKFNILKEQALLNDDLLLVFFDREENEIIVKDIKTQRKYSYLKIPSSLTLIRNTQVKIYSETGISPITISFKDLKTNQIYHLTLQMGWGALSFVKV